MTESGVALELARILAHERSILGRLQLAMATVRLLLAAGENRFLVPATDEIHDLLDAVGVTEAMRAAVTADTAARLGIDEPEPALADIVAALPAAEAVEIDNLGEALRRAVAELGELGTEGADLAVRSIGGLRATLDRLTAAPGVAAQGEGTWVVDGPNRPAVFDGTI